MALYFAKRRRWPPSKTVQFLLALLALLVALAVLISWLVIGYHQDTQPSNTPDSTTTHAAAQAAPPSTSLVIFDIEGAPQFALVQARPAAAQMSCVAIPATLTDPDGCSLATALKKHGAPHIQQAVATALGLPIDHYISLSLAGVEQFLNQLDSGLIATVPETLTYTDANGTALRLSAGEHTLTTAQASALLRHTGWKKAAHRGTVAAHLTTALLNQYLTAERSLSGLFAALSNAALTDLRIDHFNAYQEALATLAAQNNGAICRRFSLPGQQKDGVFTPDIPALRTQTDLYN